MIAFYASDQDPNTQKLAVLLEQEGFQILRLGDDQLDLTMKDILQADTAGKSTATGPAFLYFDKEPHDAVFALQKKLHALNIPQPAMAVYTENNSTWTLRSLMQEVQREARYFARRDYLATLVHQVSRKEMEENPEFAKAVFMAYSLLQQDELPEDLLEMGIAFLEAAPKEQS